jgi:hypothetical protein
VNEIAADVVVVVLLQVVIEVIAGAWMFSGVGGCYGCRCGVIVVIMVGWVDVGR